MEFVKSFLTFCGTVEHKYAAIIGFAYGILSNFFFTTANFIARRLETKYPIFEIIYLFSIQIFLYNYLLLKRRGISFSLSTALKNKWALFRSWIGTVETGFLFYGFPLMAYSEALVIFNTSPALSGLLAVPLLNEKYSLSLFVSAVLNLSGVVLIAKPETLFGVVNESQEMYEYRVLGIIMMLLAASLDGILQVSTRKLSTFSINASILAALFGITLSLGAITMQLFEGSAALSAYDYGLMLFIGL